MEINVEYFFRNIIAAAGNSCNCCFNIGIRVRIIRYGGISLNVKFVFLAVCFNSHFINIYILRTHNGSWDKLIVGVIYPRHSIFIHLINNSAAQKIKHSVLIGLCSFIAYFEIGILCLYRNIRLIKSVRLYFFIIGRYGDHLFCCKIADIVYHICYSFFISNSAVGRSNNVACGECRIIGIFKHNIFSKQ